MSIVCAPRQPSAAGLLKHVPQDPGYKPSQLQAHQI